MKIDNIKPPKRLGIFFFYDEDGIVDDYVIFFLENIKKYISDLLVVCNGKLTPKGKEKLLESSTNIIVRENYGFDVWAYKEGMNFIGSEKMAQFDEIILFNSTIFGPIHSFDDMFKEMDKRDLDFWGITKYHKMPFDPFGTIKYGYTPEHIQSHFIAVRKNMVNSYEFKKYWKDMKMVNSYEEAIGFHEAIFTKEFSDKGYTWDVYVDTDDLKEHVYHPILMMPLELVKDRKCPIFKRRSFFHNMGDFLNNTTNQQSLEFYEYIKNKTSYNVNLIWDNVLRTNNMADIKNALNLNYVLPTSINKTIELPPSKKIALILHIYFEDLIEYCLNYAKSMPVESDIFITTDTEEKKKSIKKAFEEIKCANFKIILIKNRGRDISALLVGCKDFLFDYEYVCFAHDKKTKQLEPFIKGESFSYRCFENVLGSREFVENIINTFEENPKLGLLSPPPPNHADFYITIGLEWTNNFEITKKLADKLNLNVDMNNVKEPVAPLGTMFWFRPNALKALIQYDWEYEDFPKEPNNNDGTILHAIERIYPFVAQHEGYYSGWLLSDKSARIEITNLYYMLRQINLAYVSKCGPTNHYTLVSNLQYNSTKIYSPFRSRSKQFLKKYLPNPILNVLIRLKKYIK
ncbi:rhamnosyltransferase [Cytobacillus eiseniae]|uniref:Rhamnosyltransferase n=1 Tax=Cytobacillus eiseniae TaxID=762947 RepID=A0ABS4RHW5_9BACI|nr:rhamnan synthesis F family protein [Cytobacillus eiseniae]MBP2242348.1 rhamnosyltransferase [Cytobacillus eiseniae]